MLIGALEVIPDLLACEPVPVLMQLWMGPIYNLKVALSGTAALVLIVALKAVVFLWYVRVKPLRGIIAVVLANAISTFPGIFIGIMLSAGGGPILLFMAFAVLGVTASVAKVFLDSLKGSAWSWLTPAVFTVVTIGLTLLTTLLGLMIYTQADAMGSPVGYWILKILASFGVVAASLGITIMWEGAVIMWFFRSMPDRGPVIKGVVASNLWAFFIAFLAGAAVACPERLKNPQFLMPVEPGRPQIE